MDNLTQLGLGMIYLLPVAMSFKSTKITLTISLVAGICFWVTCFLGLFKEPYKKKKALKNQNYQEIKKLPHRTGI